MKLCSKCNHQMLEDLDLVTPGYAKLAIKEKGIHTDHVYLKCAVCPDCGYTEVYVDNLEKFNRRFNQKNKNGE